MKKSQLKSLVKTIIKEMKESTEPSIGGSYGDQQTGVDSSNVRPERDSLTDPMLKESLPHPYKISIETIARDIVSKAARIRDEYHMTYDEALKSVMMNLQNKVSKVPTPPERFPATGTRKRIPFSKNQRLPA